MTIIKTIFQNPRFGFYKKNDGKIYKYLFIVYNNVVDNEINFLFDLSESHVKFN